MVSKNRNANTKIVFCFFKFFSIVAGFIRMPQLISCMEYNYAQWKLYEERGIHTLNDIKNEQMSLGIDQNSHPTNS